MGNEHRAGLVFLVIQAPPTTRSRNSLPRLGIDWLAVLAIYAVGIAGLFAIAKG